MDVLPLMNRGWKIVRKLFYKLQLRYYYNKLKTYDSQIADDYSEKYLKTEGKLRRLRENRK